MNSYQLGRATLALCLGSLIVFANLYTTQPLLPLFVSEFALTELEAARSLTVTTLMLGLSLLFYGAWSDAIGRKIIMVMSLCGISLTTLALSYVETFEQLLWLRGLHGFLLGGIPATAIAYIGEEFPRTKVAAAIGLYISANSLGGIFGRAFSGIISDLWDWQMVFSLMTLANIAVAIFFITTLPASTAFRSQKLNSRTIINGLTTHLSNRNLLQAYLIGGCNFMIVLTLYSYVIFLLADEPFSLSNSWLGLLFLTYLSGSIGSAYIGKIDKKISCAERIVIGTALIIVGTLVTLYGNLSAIIIGLFINAFGFFIAHSSLSTWVNQYAIGSKASASSLYLVFYYLGASIGNTYLDPFWRWGQYQGVVGAATLTLLVSLLATLWLRKQEKHPG